LTLGLNVLGTVKAKTSGAARRPWPRLRASQSRIGRAVNGLQTK